MNKLYHKDVYWKYWFDDASLRLIKSADKLSLHMWGHIDKNSNAKHDIDIGKLYLIIQRLHYHGLSKSDYIFEVETEKHRFYSSNETLIKCVVRCMYDENRDINIVFKNGIIVTAWLNNKDDQHTTLDTSKYEKGGNE